MINSATGNIILILLRMMKPWGALMLIVLFLPRFVSLSVAESFADDNALRLEIYKHAVRPCNAIMYEGLTETHGPTISFDAFLRLDYMRKDNLELIEDIFALFITKGFVNNSVARMNSYATLREVCAGQIEELVNEEEDARLAEELNLFR